MADIIQFTLKPKPSLPIEKVAERAREEVMGQWEKFVGKNRLNEYFVSCTTAYCREGVNYLEDLNALSAVEARIGLEPQVCAPGFGVDQTGWLAAFRMNGVVICTTYMPFETYARALNILLYLKVKRDLS